MKILNRPMFRYGGPIKEGIMDGIQEPRQRYAEAGDVFKQIAEGYQTGPQVSQPLRINQQPRSDVLNAASQLGIANPYKDNSKTYMPFAKKYVTKPTYIAPEKTQDDMLFEDVENSGQKGDGLNEKTIAKLKANIFNMPDNLKQIQARERLANERQDGFLPTPRFNSDQGAANIEEVIKEKDTVIDTEGNRKKSINNILEKLGYARSQKNALYDALIAGGQRISREGLGKTNLVNDLIADTSTAYDKPEKIRQAAELMQVQQDLKLEGIRESKTGGARQQDYDYYINQGDSPALAKQKADGVATTIVAMKERAKKMGDGQGDAQVESVAQQMVDGNWFPDKDYKGTISGKKYDNITEFVESAEFKSEGKGAGIYVVKGKVIELDENGKMIFDKVVTSSTSNSKWWNPLD